MRKNIRSLLAGALMLLSAIPSYAATKPLATTVYVSLDNGTDVNGPIRRGGRRGATPEQVVTTITVPEVKEYTFGKLVVTLLGAHNDNQTGMATMLFIGPYNKVARGAKRLKFVPTTADDIRHMRWFPVEASDGYDRTTLKKFRPLVPEDIINDPDPKVQKQLKRLMRKWVAPHLLLSYVFAPDYGPGSTK